MLCDIGNEIWKEAMKKGKYHVLLRMIKFEYIRGAWEDYDQLLGIKWKKSYFAWQMAEITMRLLRSQRWIDHYFMCLRLVHIMIEC